jgi:N-acetylmuramoyl-L-alanine amidase
MSPDGFYWCVAEEASCAAPALAGYRPVGGSGDPIPARWSALFGGALSGRRIVLDPEGGGEDAAGVGPGGTRAAALNLETARILRSFLEAAGAQVALTRQGDYAISEVERVQIAERFRPERYLRLSLRAEDPQLGYYFSSVPGRAWATRSADWLARMGVARNLLPREDAQYVIQQTSCPALVLAPLRVDRRSDETRLLEPGFTRRLAYAALLALAEDLAPPASPWETDSITVTSPDDLPTPRALVELGGLLHQTDARGIVRFARTEPGALEAREASERRRLAAVLLDSERGRRVVLPPSGE